MLATVRTIAMSASTTAKPVYNLSFAGCGFLGIYHLGAAACIVKHGQGLLKNVERYGGASAGSLVAATLLCGRDKLQHCIDFTYNLAREIKKKPLGALTPGYNLIVPLEKFLREMLPEDAHDIAKDRLFISVTNMRTKKNEVFSEYESREELIQCLLASCFIPAYAGFRLPKIRNQKYADGGITDNLPKFEEGQTISVSPFSGGQNICPKDKNGLGMYINVVNQEFQVNLHNGARVLHALFPPKRRTLESYYQKGVRDAERFLIEEDMFERGDILWYETSV
ncbi:patatin-like phospholipase domain-containing protein 4 [Lineus longissimus]|uniref:patatin-like phospholipase domain-containing protein 4 n=1 Tax=Lineus longissimus TaxID=88925 RepID=UPI002B4EFE8E